MTPTLFTAADVYDGDPLRPDLITPTPDEVVANLSPVDRVERVHYLIDQAHDIVDLAVDAMRDAQDAQQPGEGGAKLVHLIRPRDLDPALGPQTD